MITMSFFQILAVCIYGVIGSLLRYFIVKLFEKFFPQKSYWSIAIINITSGAIIAMMLFRGLNILYDRELLLSGLLGGFTSYSSLIFEVLKLALRVNYIFAFLYLVFTLGMSFIIFYLSVLLLNLL